MANDFNLTKLLKSTKQQTQTSASNKRNYSLEEYKNINF